MSEQAWTKEPWFSAGGGLILTDRDDGIIADFRGNSNAHLDSMRTEACVNALSGIPNPAEFVRAARECEQAVRSVFPLMNATTLDAIAFELECPDPKRTTTTSAKCEFFRDLAKRLREADAALSAFRAAGGAQ